MIEFFQLTNLMSYKLKRFPVEIRDTIRSNVEPLTGEFHAVYAVDENQAIAAGGIRKNEDGEWIAWFWIDNQKAHVYRILRKALVELDRYQKIIQKPIHAIVSKFNPIGIRLAERFGFERVGEYQDLIDRAKSFYLYKRDYHGRESDVGGGVAGLSGNLG